MIRSVKRHLVRPVLLLLLMSSSLSALHVRDYGAVPDTGEDQARAIQRAIDAAVAAGESVVEFDPGTYRITEVSRLTPYNARRACLIVDGAQGLTLRGATTSDGLPATALVYDEPGPRFSIDYVIWLSRSRDLGLENLLIDCPGALASGRITKVADGQTWVELWPEVPKPRSFIAEAEYVFLYDPANGELIAPKITLNGGWDEVRRGDPLPPTRDTPMARLTAGHGFVIDAELGAVGQGLVYPSQWHHAPEKTLVANQIDGLTLRNLTIVQALGHVLLPVGCRDITVQHVRFDPGARGSPRGWTARRDGLTLRACRGELLIEDSLFQCTSDDMLAFWGFQFHVEDVLSPERIVVSSRQASGDYFLDFPVMIEPGDWIELRRPDGRGHHPLTGQRLTITGATIEVDRSQRMPWTRHFAAEIEREAWVVRYTLDLAEPLPEAFRQQDTRIVLLGSTLLDEAILRRVTTRNITNHPGVLIPGATDYLVEDCNFGSKVEISVSDGSRTWHGGTGLWRGTFRRNTFTASAAVPTRNGFEADSIARDVRTGPVIIEDNLFIHGATLTLGGSAAVIARRNRFELAAGVVPIQRFDDWEAPLELTDNRLRVIDGEQDGEQEISTAVPVPRRRRISTPPPVPPGS